MTGRSLACVLAILSFSEVASADEETARCLASYEHGQELRKNGHLSEAKSEFLLCSRDVCPELARRDCVPWTREIESAVPSIVVAARTEDGGDVPMRELVIDDQRVQDGPAGRPIEIDPGPHHLRARLADGRLLESDIVVVLGEKNRFVKLAAPAPMRAEPPPPASSRSPWPWIVGGAGVAVFGTGLALDLVGSGDLRDLRHDCAPGCASSDVDATRTKIIVGDVLLGVGVVLGAAAVLLALRHGPPAARTARAW